MRRICFKGFFLSFKKYFGKLDETISLYKKFYLKMYGNYKTRFFKKTYYMLKRKQKMIKSGKMIQVKKFIEILLQMRINKKRKEELEEKLTRRKKLVVFQCFGNIKLINQKYYEEMFQSFTEKSFLLKGTIIKTKTIKRIKDKILLR